MMINAQRSFLLIATVATFAIAACTGGGGDGQPTTVHDDVYVVSNAGPARIFVDGDTAWVVNYVANSLDAVDLTTCGASQNSCDALGTTPFDPGTGPFDGTLAGGNLYLAMTNVAQVVGVDTTTRLPVATISTGAAGLVTPQSVAAASSKLFVADSNFYGGGPGFVAVVSGTSITGVIQTSQLQPVGFTTLASGDLAVTNLGYVDFGQSPAVATSAGGIDIIDPMTETITDTIDLGLTSPICRVAVYGTAGYTASGTEGTLLKVDLVTGGVTETQVTATPGFLTWTEVVGDLLYVLSSTEDRIYVFDAATTTPIDVGDGTNVITVGPGGATPKGPSHASTWIDPDGVTHLLVVMALANSVTDVVLQGPLQP